MGNHHIDCAFCGQDTRGLSGVRGCCSREEANRCGNYEKPSVPATPAQPAGAVPDSLREKIRLAIASVNVHSEASEYEFRADEGDHTPTDAERAMLEDFGEQILSHLEAALISTVPASPAPETLEALTEKLARALEPKAFADWEADYQSRLRHQQQTGAKPGPTFEGMGAIVVMKAARERAKALLEGPLASLLASHPAGQSAGSGAETKPDAGRLLKEALFACLKEGSHDQSYGGVLAAGGKKAWVRFSLVDDETSAAFAAGKPAPDSPLTGPVGRGGTAAVPIEPTEAMWRAFGTLTPEAFRQKWKEALAARPAAPEAQGLADLISAKVAEIGPIFLDMENGSRRPGIYIASKTTHAPRWRQLRADGLPIISTWIDEAGKGETACFTDLWQRCVDEAASADAVIVYREPGEVLKGAFVEVGAALAVGTPVYAIGCDEFSFAHHASVTRCADLRQALDLAAPPASSGQEG